MTEEQRQITPPQDIDAFVNALMDLPAILAENLCEARGLDYRTIKNNGRAINVADDVDERRVNFQIKDKIVVGVHLG